MSGSTGAAGGGANLQTYTTAVPKPMVCYAPTEVTYEQLVEQAKGIDAGQFQAAAQTFSAVSQQISSVVQAVPGQVVAPLGQAWAGPSAELSQAQIATAQTTMASLEQYCGTMASAMTQAYQAATSFLAAVKAMPKPESPLSPLIGPLNDGTSGSGVTPAQAKATATKVLNGFLAQLQQITVDLPDQVQINLNVPPNPDQTFSPVGTGSGTGRHVRSTSASGAGEGAAAPVSVGSVAASGTGGTHRATLSTTTHVPDASHPSTVATSAPSTSTVPARATLAGSGSGGVDLAGTVTGAAGGVGLGAAGAGTSAGAGLTAAVLPAGGVSLTGSGAAMSGAVQTSGDAAVTGAVADEAAAQEAAAAQAAQAEAETAGPAAVLAGEPTGVGTVMAPLGGAGGGGGTEYGRSSWLAEDDEVWGGTGGGPEALGTGEPSAALAGESEAVVAGEPNGAGTAMAPLGGAGAGSRGGRDRSTWLIEDDVWGDDVPVAPAVICG